MRFEDISIAAAIVPIYHFCNDGFTLLMYLNKYLYTILTMMLGGEVKQ